MKALTIRQPWAYLIATGSKTLEVRRWSTNHRGELLICAAARPKNTFVFKPETRARVPLYAGCMICVVNLIDVRPMERADADAASSPYDPGAFAWLLENPRFVRPDPIAGRLGLWDVSGLDVCCLESEDKHFSYPPPQGNVRWRVGNTCILDEGPAAPGEQMSLGLRLPWA